MFGHTTRLPLDIEMGKTLMEQWDASCQNYVKKLNARLEWAYKVACENIQKESEHHKKSNEVAFLWNRTLVEL